MIRLGILTSDDPVELLEGWIIQKMPKNPPHRVANKLVRNALEEIVPAGWYVDAQEPVTLKDSEPEPDVVIVQCDTRDYTERHPGSNDLALVVEIADSTLERDRTYKKRIYACAGIPVYWIVNLIEQQIEVYTQPDVSGEEATYIGRSCYDLSSQVSVMIEGCEVGRLNVRDLLS
ncbi:MAG: Uma2 family endonuclease [Calothrix sp. FI2-JRJ7]|nr:Uma2 family endonuclease [Calothrix sp. FI2-JRJ7]